MNHYTNDVEYEDLTPDIRLIADVCGMDTVRKMLQHLSGMQFYIPKITSFQTFIRRYIKQNSSRSFKEIALELCVSEQYIKSVRNKSKTA
ncbi:MAG: hypothetical protein WCZ17_02215 [Candidatus Kapaibacterium sp.]|jgi:hypothetical protein|nr:hypothetical protein [Candidatus Kapabacteria bacterium]